MADKQLSKDKIEALEQILGVKLPEAGFELEIRPIGEGELRSDELEGVSGGVDVARVGRVGGERLLVVVEAAAVVDQRCR